MQTTTTPNFRIAMANPPYTGGHDALYAIVAQVIASQPDPLAELVELFTAIERAGVQMDEHWDCLVEALILEREII